MQQGRERFRNRVIPIVLLIGAALVLLAACGDGGGGYAIVALPAGAGWWSGVRQSRIVGAVSQLAGGEAGRIWYRRRTTPRRLAHGSSGLLRHRLIEIHQMHAEPLEQATADLSRHGTSRCRIKGEHDAH